MEELNMKDFMRDYCVQVENLKQYIPSIYLSCLFQISQDNGAHFFNTKKLAETYNMIPDEAKNAFKKILYTELVMRYQRLVLNSDVKSSTYKDENIYNIKSYFCPDNPLLSFELKYDEKNGDKKIDFIFYDDLMENDEMIRLHREIAHIDEELYNNEKEIKNIPFDLRMNMMIGGGPSLYVQKSECDYKLGCEFNKIYSGREYEGFTIRKSLLEIYFNAFECCTDYYNLDRTSIEDENRIILKKYPYMDLSIIFTNKRDIKDADKEKIFVKK